MLNNKKSRKIITAIFMTSVIVLAGCLDNNFDPVHYDKMKERSITFRATMPKDKPSTRIALEESEEGLNFLAKWKTGDMIQLFFVQEEIRVEGNSAVIFDISEDGRQSSFVITVPDEIDLSSTFDLYAFCGIPGQGVKITDGIILADIEPVRNIELSEFEVPVWSKSKDISLFTDDINLNFSHLGAYEVIHIKNNSGSTLDVSQCYLTPAEQSSQLWYYDSGSETIPVLNVITGEVTYVQKENSQQQESEPQTIESGEVKTIINWYVPNQEDIPEIMVKLNNTDSSDSKTAKGYPMLPGRAYHLYTVWEGTKLHITADDFLIDIPKITLKTAKAIGEMIHLLIQADEDAEIWIDLNGNGIMDEGERVLFHWIDTTKSGYQIGTQEINIYGEIIELDCGDNSIIELDLSNITSLTHLYCYRNELTKLNIRSLKDLEILSCSNNQLTELDLSNNSNLKSFRCADNLLTNLDVSILTELATFDCTENNQLNCIKVNQAQLNDIPTRWSKDESAEYSLTCD